MKLPLIKKYEIESDFATDLHPIWSSMTPEAHAETITIARASLAEVTNAIRHADFKVAPVLAAAAGLCALVGNNAPTWIKSAPGPLTYFAIITTVAFFIVSLVYSSLAILPRMYSFLQSKDKTSQDTDSRAMTILYFEHVNSHNDEMHIGENLIETTNDSFVLFLQYVQQLKSNAAIASKKYRNISYAIRWLFAGVFASIFWTLIAIAMSIQR